ncbi:MAG: cyclic nucleotide-binding domain-containing protein [Deltaproteobacteria bacterium]|nr:cyclic nucleotide-binding domain-containing protein [Deltaproteobacteria bacterium]
MENTLIGSGITKMIDMVNGLKSSRPFRDIPEDQIIKLIEESKLVSFDERAVILNEGDPNDQVFFLLRGKLAVFLDGKPIINLHRKGDIIGEMSVICNKQCAATVIADTDVDLLQIDGRKIIHFGAAKDDTSASVLYKIFCSILTDKLFITTTKAQGFEEANLELEQRRIDLKEAYEKSVGEISKRIQSDQTIKHYQDHLEELVEQRTDQLQKAKLEAEKATREKSEFLANVSHELRTPMHAILGFTKLSIDRFESLSSEKQFDYLHKVLRSGQSLLRLLNDILDLAKHEENRVDYYFTNASLSYLVKLVMSDFEALFKAKSILIDFQPHEFDDIVKIDQEKIIQVLRNLISNALKFSKEDSLIKLSVAKEQEKVLFSIIDQGMGIPENELNTVFDKFVQSSKTRANDGGTGLGLAISKKIIIDHNGKIWAERNPTGGAIIRFLLPFSK